MTRWQQVLLVAGWEFRRFVKWKQQLVSMALMVGIFLGWAVFKRASERSATRAERVAVVGAASLGAALPPATGVEWLPDAYPTAEAARRAVQADSVAGALIVLSPDSAELVIRRRAAWTEPLEATLGTARRMAAFASLPLSADDRARLNTPFSLEVTTVTASGARVGRSTRIFALVILGAGLTVLFTGFATLFTGITGEKQQRITEQMIAMVSPQTWMDGKILGLTGSSAAGTAVLLAGGWLIMRIQPMISGAAPVTLPGIASDYGLLLLVLLITVLGVVMWFSFMAAIAATIDDPNNSSRSILLFVPMIPMAVGFSIIPRADSVLAQVLSFFPLTSMGVLPARLMTTTVPWWETLASIALLAAAAWFFRRMAGKIFATGVLMYGKEPTFAEMWRWSRDA